MALESAAARLGEAEPEALAVSARGLLGAWDRHSEQDTGHGLGSKGEEAPQQQLSERPGVWSVPHQWGVQLWLRMKASERERGLKAPRVSSNPPKTRREGSVGLQEGFFIWKILCEGEKEKGEGRRERGRLLSRECWGKADGKEHLGRSGQAEGESAELCRTWECGRAQV